MVCDECGFAIQYCACAGLLEEEPTPEEEARVAASLEQRIKEIKR
jgi:hypothetical protein